MGVMDQRACKKLCESIANMAEKAAAAAADSDLHAGLQLYAVLAAYCMDNAERVSVVCMCYYMMLASLGDRSTKWQDLLLKFMSERDGSLRALLGNEALALVSDNGVKGVHKQLLRSNVLSEHALQQWPDSAATADGLRASAAKLMSIGSFRTVLECERMSWDVMLAPFEEDGTEATVQGSMRALVQRVMGDYERLADWCGSAAAAAQDEQQQEQQPVKVTKDPPIGADVFVDDLGSRDADLRSSSAKEYDQKILQDDVQDESLSRKKLAIVYGFDCMRYLLCHGAFALLLLHGMDL